MARRPRVFLPGQPVHVIQRGHSRSQVFFGAEDAKTYLEWLHEASAKHGLAVHAYVLMPNHVHLLASPETEQSLPKALRDVNWRYSRYANAAHGRSGSFWDGRYKAAIVDTEHYFFACSRYVELNPVRAGLAKSTEAFRWSSYKANTGKATSDLLTPHKLYLDLGSTPAARASAYRELFEAALSEATIDAIRKATNGGWALGSDAFETRIGRVAGQNMAPRGPGRPWREKAALDTAA